MKYLSTFLILIFSFSSPILFAQTYTWGGKVVTKKQYDKLLHKFTVDFIKNYVYDSNEYISDKILLAKLKAEQAENGLAILYDLKNNIIVSESYFSKNGKYYKKDPSLYNKAIEPGSLILPMSGALIMDNFGVTLSDTVDLEQGKAIINGRVIMDAEQYGKQAANLLTIISESSNVGIAKMVNKSFKKTNNQYNFQDVINEYVGDTIYKLNETSDIYQIPFQSFGYGLQLTPNQILNFYKRVAQSDSTLFNNLNTLTQVQKALKEVCTNGTAKTLFRDNKNTFAGKTGTSLVYGKNGYASRQFQSSFIGYDAVESPNYICLVIIKCKPKSPNHFGASVAGPVFKSIMENILKKNRDNENLNPDVIKIEVPKEYQDELLKNRNHYHHLEDSVSAISNHDLQSDSSRFSLSNKFYVDGKWQSGYDGGIIGYYMSACWKNALPIINKFIEIDRVIGCSSEQIGDNQTIYHYTCVKYIKTRATFKNGNPVYKTEYIDVYFKK
jgi:hypothetical protein